MNSATRLVTTCPSCDAKFYVTPEQLSAHRGDVRCGKCAHVFNALDALNQLSPSTETIPEQNSDTSAHAESTSPASTIEETASSPIAELAQNTATTIPAFNFSDFNGAISNNSDFDDTESSVEDPENDVKPLKSKIRFSLSCLLVLVLVLIGIAQASYYLRTEIASQWPITTPYLKLACAHLNCKVELPKHQELLMIDDSDLQEDSERTGLIHLSSTLVNNASFAQAYPLLELTLTDSLEKPKLRRAFTPAEYLEPNVDINKGFLAGEELQIKLAISTDGEPVVGYRVFVRY